MGPELSSFQASLLPVLDRVLLSWVPPEFRGFPACLVGASGPAPTHPVGASVSALCPFLEHVCCSVPPSPCRVCPCTASSISLVQSLGSPRNPLTASWGGWRAQRDCFHVLGSPCLVCDVQHLEGRRLLGLVWDLVPPDLRGRGDWPP